MKSFWGSFAIGVVLLGAMVAFAVLPGESAGEEEPAPAEAVISPAVDRQVCTAYELAVSRARTDRAITNVNESLTFEREGGDGGLGFYDWLDADFVSASLTDTADAAATAAGLPGLTADVYEPMRDVVATASDLEAAAVSGSVFVVGDVEDAAAALKDALDAAEDACA